MWWVIGLVTMALMAYVGVWLSNLRVKETLECPVHACVYEGQVERRLSATWEPSKRLRVLACTHFDSETDVTCEQLCLRN